MGGYGSGTRGGRPTVEGSASLLALDAKRAMRPVLAAHRDRGFRPGEVMNAGPIRFAWTRAGEAEPWAAVAVSLELGPDRGRAWLTLVHQAGRRTTGPLDQRVRLEAVPCRFGGARWWWVCPATGRRAATLYLPVGGARFLRGRRTGSSTPRSARTRWRGRTVARLGCTACSAARAHQRSATRLPSRNGCARPPTSG